MTIKDVLYRPILARCSSIFFACRDQEMTECLATSPERGSRKDSKAANSRMASEKVIRRSSI